MFFYNFLFFFFFHSFFQILKSHEPYNIFFFFELNTE